MKYRFEQMTEKHASKICKWQYEPPYSMYSMTVDDISYLIDPANQYFSISTSADEIIGYCCFGKDAQVPGGTYQSPSSESLDLGIGMRPDLTGQGLGVEFVREVLDFGLEQFSPKGFRASIAAFNLRSVAVFERLGFGQTHTFERESDKLEFKQLERPLL